MTIAATPTAPTHQPMPHGSDRGPAVRIDPNGTHSVTSGPPARTALTLFEVPFATAMMDDALALLARTLDLTTCTHSMMRPRHESPGLVRLDHYSGLFLNRGGTEGQWTLEARTWGRPAAQSVHEWHVLAAGAARQLDPTVPVPERVSAASPETPDYQVGRAANKRFARSRRRITGAL
jgi:hypothetical protein